METDESPLGECVRSPATTTIAAQGYHVAIKPAALKGAFMQGDFAGWSFSKGPEGWVWAYVDLLRGEERHSDQPFPTLLDCVDDAARNGYRRPVVP